MATMKRLLLSAALLATSATAQVLTHGTGAQLPLCAHTCPVLLNSASSCNANSGQSLADWACFCQAVYTGSGSNPAAICPTTCSGADLTSVQDWFTANCGDDNGQSEHDGSATTTSVPGASATPTSGSTSSSTGSPATNGGQLTGESNCQGTWFHCHYQWVIMIIVVAVGLIALGFGGRWLKRRHDRRADQIRGGFNDGVTSRNAHNDDKAYGGAAAFGSHRDSPARTRDNFMPYGYGYSRGGGDGSQSEFERGGSPIEMEKSRSGWDEEDGSGARDRIKRALVRDGRR